MFGALPMILVAYNRKQQHFTFVRELHAKEVSSHAEYNKTFTEARSRLGLFRMLHRNFLQWRSLIDDLLNAKANEPEDTLEELNRLLLNYLTCAYTIREHFEVSFQHRYRKDNNRQGEFDAFLTSLCSQYWSFGFFLDFRGYVQHRGVGVGHYSRQVQQAAVHVVVSADAQQLLSKSRNWKRSTLNPSHGRIDLVTHLQEFHICMLQHFGGFVAKTFFPELKPASDFYAALTTEAKAKDVFARMMFMEEPPKVFRDGAKISTTLNLICVPNSVFEELGIRISSSAEPGAAPSGGPATPVDNTGVAEGPPSVR